MVVSVPEGLQREIRMLPQPLVNPLRPSATALKRISRFSDCRDPRSWHVEDRGDFGACAELMGTGEVRKSTRLRGALRSTLATGLLTTGRRVGSENRLGALKYGVVANIYFSLESALAATVSS